MQITRGGEEGAAPSIPPPSRRAAFWGGDGGAGETAVSLHPTPRYSSAQEPPRIPHGASHLSQG